MTLPLQKTLSEVREEVLARAGIAESSAHNANIQRQVDSYIRDAHRYYYLDAVWFDSHTREEITLSDDVAVYDFPDNAEPGTIYGVHIVDVNSDRPYELIPMPTPHERYWAKPNDDSGRPVYYEYLDGGIKLWPAPDTSQYDTLIVDYRVRETSLVNDSDRLQVDSGLVVQRALVDLKVFLGQPGINATKQHLLEYEQKILSLQNNRKSVNLTDYAKPQLYGSRYRRTHDRYNYRGGEYYGVFRYWS